MYFYRVAAVLAALVVADAAAAQVTSNFGTRRDPINGSHRMHAGMDMAGRIGTAIYATGDGYVRRARVAGGYGNLVEIEHGFGYQTRYGHLSRMLVAEGQFVRRGQMIAMMGSTGRSTGSHLHYEVRINGKAVNPARYMQIVFSQQPDWNSVRMAAVYSPTPQVAQRQSGTVAMALAATRRERQLAPVNEVSYGMRGAQPSASQTPRATSISDGHVKFGGRE